MSSNSRVGLTTVRFRPPLRRTVGVVMASLLRLVTVRTLTVTMLPGRGDEHILQPGSPDIAGDLSAPRHEDARSDQQPEDAERAFPFLGVHGFHVGLNEPEGPGEGHADAAEELRKPGLRRVAERIVERRAGHEGFEDGPELDLLFDAPERVRALLQAFGYRQVPGLDDVAEVGLRGGLRYQQQVINRVVDEIEVALDVVPVDADAARGAEEALELGKPHYWHRCLLTSRATSCRAAVPARAIVVMCVSPCGGGLCWPGSFEGEPDGHCALADGCG